MEIKNFDQLENAKKRLEMLTTFGSDLDGLEVEILRVIRENPSGKVGKQFNTALCNLKKQVNKIQASVGAKREITAVALNKWRDSFDDNDYHLPSFADARGQQTIAEAMGLMAFEEERE